MCSAGKYECGEWGAKADRKCCPAKACNPDEWMTQDHTATADRVCQQHTPCETGLEFESARGTNEADRQCQAVKDCADEATPSYRVTPATADRDTICRALTVCGAGTHERTAPGKARDRGCRGCDGYQQYQDEAGQKQCKPVTKCTAGEFVDTAATPSSDNVCKAITVCVASRSISPPHGSQSDFVWPSARTPHGGASYVWCLTA